MRTAATTNNHRSSPDRRVDSLAHILLKRIVSAHGGSLDTVYDPAFVMTLRWPRFQVGEPASVANESANLMDAQSDPVRQCRSQPIPGVFSGCAGALALPPLTVSRVRRLTCDWPMKRGA